MKKSDPQTEISAELSMSIVDVACNLYLYAQDVFAGFDEDSFMIINYDDLVVRPKEIVEMIYNKWDMEIGSDFAVKLKNDTEKSKDYKSKHSYSLEQFGVHMVQIHGIEYQKESLMIMLASKLNKKS